MAWLQQPRYDVLVVHVWAENVREEAIRSGPLKWDLCRNITFARRMRRVYIRFLGADIRPKPSTAAEKGLHSF